MCQIKAYVKMNIKSLLINKLSMLWSIILPIFMLIINSYNISHWEHLRYWWIYIIMNCYVYGVGLHAVNVRESGTLKTLFSINRKPIEFFLANLITQVLYALTSLVLFNVCAKIMFGFSFINMMCSTMVYIIVLIPVAFLGYNITLIKKMNYNTVSMIVNIFMFVMLSFSTMQFVDAINPIAYYARLLYSSVQNILVYVVASVVSVILSMRSIKQYTAMVTWKR